VREERELYVVNRFEDKKQYLRVLMKILIFATSPLSKSLNIFSLKNIKEI